MGDNRFTLYMAGIGASVIPATEVTNELGAQEWTESHSGEVDIIASGVQRIQPVVRFTSRSVLAALGICGLAPVALTAQAPGTFFWRQMALGGLRVAGVTATHEKRVLSSGMLVPMRIESGGAGANDRASIQYEAHACGAAPIAFSAAALAGVIPTSVAYSKLGPIVLVDIDDNYIIIPPQNWSLELGYNVIKDGDSGNVYDTFVGAMSRAARLRLTSRDVSQGTALAGVGSGTYWGSSPLTAETLPVGFDGLQIVQACAYLRTLAPGGQAYADAETEHIEFKITSGSIMTVSERATQGGLADIEINVPVASDGTNPIVDINLAAAIVTEAPE